MSDDGGPAVRSLRPADGWAAGHGGRRTWAGIESRIAAAAPEVRPPLITRRRALIGGAVVAGGGVAAAVLPVLTLQNRPDSPDLFARLPADPALARLRYRTLTELTRASKTIVRARVRSAERLGSLSDQDGGQADLIGLRLDPTKIIGAAPQDPWVVQFRAPADTDPLPVPTADGVWFLGFPTSMADADPGAIVGEWLTNDQGLFLAEAGRLRNPIGPTGDPLITELSALPTLDELIDRVEQAR
ncbi:hypothetical protein [Microlunatus speluncae]|uniref:hypothetical protein n=1 Tax=Microlunatus speluncae TaxID=2594267 RepID=UPI0012667924|nr:hypothetical protein [Microlunatus speluncae]